SSDLSGSAAARTWRGTHSSWQAQLVGHRSQRKAGHRSDRGRYHRKTLRLFCLTVFTSSAEAASPSGVVASAYRRVRAHELLVELAGVVHDRAAGLFDVS